MSLLAPPPLRFRQSVYTVFDEVLAQSEVKVVWTHTGPAVIDHLEWVVWHESLARLRLRTRNAAGTLVPIANMSSDEGAAAESVLAPSFLNENPCDWVKVLQYDTDLNVYRFALSADFFRSLPNGGEIQALNQSGASTRRMRIMLRARTLS